LLVDTEGLVLRAKVHSAKVLDKVGIKALLDGGAKGMFPRLSHLWLWTLLTEVKRKAEAGWRSS
jgi:hypothetical protein